MKSWQNGRRPQLSHPDALRRSWDPTLLVFKDGQVKEQIVGYVPKEQIQKALDKHVG